MMHSSKRILALSRRNYRQFSSHGQNLNLTTKFNTVMAITPNFRHDSTLDFQRFYNSTTREGFQVYDNKSESAVSSPSVSVSPFVRKHLTTKRLEKFQRLLTANDANESSALIIQDITNCKDVTEMTDIIERHSGLESIDTFGVTILFDIIFALLKEEGQASKKAALNSVGMQKLFKLYRKKCRHLDSGNLINVVKLLSMMGCSSTDPNLEISIKLLTKHANSLGLNDIQYLHFVLGRIPQGEKSSLITALNFALPVVFESQISSHSTLETEGMQTLSECLFYAGRHNLPEKTIRLILTAIQKCSGKGMTPQIAKSILWTMGDLRRNDIHDEELITKCFQIMAESIQSFSEDELSTTLSKAARKYVNKQLGFFYNEDFLQAFCYKFMSRYVKSEQTLYSMKWISVFKHINVEYMDRVGEIISAQPSLVLNDDMLYLSLVRAFSGCNYKPEKWSKFEAMFLNHPALTKDIGTKEIHLALDLLALDTYPESLLHKVFAPEELPRLDSFLGRNPVVQASQLLLLYHAVQTLHPDYYGPLPPTSMIQKWKDIIQQDDLNKRKNYALKSALQTGYGGDSYVMTKVWHQGLHIDHAIVLRKGGFAAAVNPTEHNELSEIPKPAESEIVLIKVFYKEAYSNNTPRLRGIHALEQRILENLGHSVLTVDAENWNLLQDHEKIPYLMHKIREKMEKFQWNQNSDVIPS